MIEDLRTQLAARILPFVSQGAEDDVPQSFLQELADDAADALLERFVISPRDQTPAIPRYAMLDLWMALGGDSAVFERWMDNPRRDSADAWAQLLAAVRGDPMRHDHNPPPEEIAALVRAAGVSVPPQPPRAPNREEGKMEAALRPFGWTCGVDFWSRYYSDAWVFNLANVVERLSDALTRAQTAALPETMTAENLNDIADAMSERGYFTQESWLREWASFLDSREAGDQT